MAQDESAVMQKTRELCETIIAQAEFQSIQRRVTAFEDDADAQKLYESLVERHQELRQRQEMGDAIGDDAMAGFDKLRQEVLDNPVAKDFMDAQEDAHDMQKAVRRFVSKTFELGRLPASSELGDGGCCDDGCSCH